MKRNISPDKLSFFHVYASAWVGKFTEGNPTSDKIWRDHWLVVGGNWEFPARDGQTHLGPVPTTLSTGRLWKRQPYLLVVEASHVRTLLDLTLMDRHQKVLLSIENLHRMGWFPFDLRLNQTVVRVAPPPKPEGSSRRRSYSRMILLDDYTDARIDEVIASLYPQQDSQIVSSFNKLYQFIMSLLDANFFFF